MYLYLQILKSQICKILRQAAKRDWNAAQPAPGVEFLRVLRKPYILECKSIQILLRVLGHPKNLDWKSILNFFVFEKKYL